METTDSYLQEAFLPAIRRLNMDPVGVFHRKLSDQDSLLQTYVLLQVSDLSDLIKLENSLPNDETYLSAGRPYLNAPFDQPPYARIESIIMQAFMDMPQMAVPTLTGPRENRVYELRSYESSTENYFANKVQMFNAGGEIKLFDRLGFNAVFYGEVIAGCRLPNLMYMTTFSDQSTRDTLWKQFFASPEWTALIGNEKYKNNVSRADIIFLTPTAYSDY